MAAGAGETAGDQEAVPRALLRHIYTHDGWQGYGHWLGTGTGAPQNQQFITFKKALVCARSIKLESKGGWKAWCKSGKRPANVPSNPHTAYKHEGCWQGCGHWLGTGNIAGGHGHQFLPFWKARLYARSLKMKGKIAWKEWRESGERPANIHTNPPAAYKHVGWQRHGHCLGRGTGTGTVPPKQPPVPAVQESAAGCDNATRQLSAS